MLLAEEKKRGETGEFAGSGLGYPDPQKFYSLQYFVFFCPTNHAFFLYIFCLECMC